MNAHCIQHVPFEELGNIRPWLKKNGYRLTVTQVFNTPAWPDLNKVDLLIILGGPMGVYDHEQHPWLTDEIAFIQRALDMNKPVLGICLGAQLIAHALGAHVGKNPHTEIGWHPIMAHPVQPNVFEPSSKLTVFHWHGDTFDLPKGAQLLAYSEACANQAFQWQDRVIGLQYHLETNAHSVEQMLKYGADELNDGAYIQRSADISQKADRYYDAIEQEMGRVLSFLHQKVNAKSKSSYG